MTKNKLKKVSIVMGSQSDFKTMIFCQKVLKKLNIEFETKLYLLIELQTECTNMLKMQKRMVLQ